MRRRLNSVCVIVSHPCGGIESEALARADALNYQISCALRDLRRTHTDIQHLLFRPNRRRISTPLLEPRASEPVYESVERLVEGLQRYYASSKCITFILIGMMNCETLTLLSKFLFRRGHHVRAHPAMFHLSRQETHL